MNTRLSVPIVALALAATSLPAQQDTTPPAPAPLPVPAEAPKAPKSSSAQLTYEDIERMRPSVVTAYDVVQRLRPRWFQAPRQSTRLPGSYSAGQTGVRVYVDDQDLGSADFLRSIPAEQIYTMRYMTTTELGARFGPSSGPGIVVTLKH